MDKRGYNVDVNWLNPDYRGKDLRFIQCNVAEFQLRNKNRYANELTYPEHDLKYFLECIENLKAKDVKIEM